MPDYSRINQEGERLFTVRPRYTVSESGEPMRGEAATLRLVLSDPSINVEQLAQQMPYYEKKAFLKLMSPGDENGGYKDFLVTDMQYELAEKHQVFQTFGGGEAVYFYGRSPIALRLTGLVMDDQDNDQFARFAQLYMNHLRGTQMAKNYALIELNMPNATFFGSITALSFSQNSARDTDIMFSMGFLVKEVIFRSTDVYFTNESGEVVDNQENNFLGTRPTLTQREINNTIKEGTAMASLSSGTTWVDGDGNIHNSTLGLDKYTHAIASIPSMKDLLGIGMDEIMSIFNDWNNTLNEILGIPNAVINKVHDLTDEVEGYLRTVEVGLDQLMDSVTRTVGGAKGAVDRVTESVGTVVNFPQTIASKAGGFISGGFLDPQGATGAVIKGGGGSGNDGGASIPPGGGGGGSDEKAALVGSAGITSDDAAALLEAGFRADPGPVRGATLDVPPPIDVNYDDYATLKG